MIDNSNINVISHVLIRDPDSDETLLNQRDAPPTEIEDHNSMSLDDLAYFTRKLAKPMRLPLDYFGKVTTAQEEIAPENDPSGSDHNE